MTPWMNRSLFILCIACAACSRGPATEAEPTTNLIAAGPMVGHVRTGSARVWLRVAPGSELAAEAIQGERKFKPSRIEDLGDNFKLVHFEGLAPAAPVHATITASGRGEIRDTKSVDFKTAPLPGPTGKVRLVFGSCCKDSLHPAVPVFARMAEEKPDLAIFGGDNTYFIVGNGVYTTSGPKGDWTSPELMLARHLQTRRVPELQALIRSVPCYAVWDDHEFGPNDSGRDFALKADSMRIFKQMWANPGYGTQKIPGIFSSFRYGPVELFLMDDRYHKWVKTEAHSNVTPEEATIWGKEQTDWLLAGLKASDAPVKLIVNGTQVISQTKEGEGHRQEAPQELERLLSFLKNEKIDGVVFLTGDRHYSESMRLNQDKGPAILEFTSSPLQQGQAVAPLTNKNPVRLWGMRGNSFGLVTVDIPKAGEGTIRFEARDEQNRVPILGGYRCVTTTELRELNY